MSDAERQLLAILKDRSFRRGRFRLVSGGWSDYYIDGKASEVFSGSARLIGEVLYERTEALGIDAIGGMEVGAVPLATAAVIAYDLHGRRMEGFWVRDKVKDHGTTKLIEGAAFPPGARVVVLDDVITKGSSALKAVEAVRAAGCEVVQVLALVDRLEGGEERLRSAGVKDYRAVFTIRDFGVGADERDPAEGASR
jgi:orotate phosphoribosyltransferase